MVFLHLCFGIIDSASMVLNQWYCIMLAQFMPINPQVRVLLQRVFDSDRFFVNNMSVKFIFDHLIVFNSS